MFLQFLKKLETINFENLILFINIFKDFESGLRLSYV